MRRNFLRTRRSLAPAWPESIPEREHAILRAPVHGGVQTTAELLEAVAASLGLGRHHFGAQFAEPTSSASSTTRRTTRQRRLFAVVDYGYLTLLKQDDSGGLQIKADDGTWSMRPRSKTPLWSIWATRSTQHREGSTARRRTACSSARVRRVAIPSPSSSTRALAPRWSRWRIFCRRSGAAAAKRERRRTRWDDRDPTDFEGRYGITSFEVRKVFPHLASRDAIDAAMREWDRSKS